MSTSRFRLSCRNGQMLIERIVTAGGLGMVEHIPRSRKRTCLPHAPTGDPGMP